MLIQQNEEGVVITMEPEGDLKCLTLRPLSAAIQRVAVYETKLAS
jgi:hypothetical protein